jgi:hypothetical protein
MSISESKKRAEDGLRELKQIPVREVTEQWNGFQGEEVKELFDNIVTTVQGLNEKLPDAQRVSRMTDDYLLRASTAFLAATHDVQSGTELASPAEGMVISTAVMQAGSESMVKQANTINGRLQIIQAALSAISTDVVALHDSTLLARSQANGIAERQPHTIGYTERFIQQANQ